MRLDMPVSIERTIRGVYISGVQSIEYVDSVVLDLGILPPVLFSMLTKGH